jgi:hypothetical protein
LIATRLSLTFFPLHFYFFFYNSPSVLQLSLQAGIIIPMSVTFAGTVKDSQPGNRATGQPGNYTHLLKNRVNYLTAYIFNKQIIFSKKEFST